ncbi:MAG: BMP family protein [Oscillospiraceae bacterium]|nr:BMP family protein [Oscillospiraceae bacterium]
MKRKFFAALLVLTLIVGVFAACGGQTATPAAPAAPAETPADGADVEIDEAAAGIRVAAIFSGPINDGAWNETQYNGLRRIEARGAEISFVENISDADSVEAMRAFAAEGFDLIFLTTNGYQDLCFPLTQDFPDTMFIQLNGTIMSDNFISVRVPNEEQGFLAGVIAALSTETGTVGFVGGQDITPIIIGSLGFQQGVDYVNEHFGTNVEAIRVNTGNFHDVNTAKETAISMIESGADIVVPMADAAGVGVVEAVEERGVMTVGTGPGHVIMAPGNVIATIMRDNAYVYDAVWEMFVSGQWPTEVEAHGVARGVVYAQDWIDGVDPEVISRLEQVMDEMRAGNIYIDRGL